MSEEGSDPGRPEPSDVPAPPADGATTVQLKTGASAQYLDGVRDALADLPAPEVAEILDDTRAHLSDLADELGADAGLDALTARLGSPAAYAAELRSAAGYPPVPVAPVASPRPRTGIARLAVLALAACTFFVVVGVLTREPALVLFGAVLLIAALPLLIKDGPSLPTVVGLPSVQRVLNARDATSGPTRTAADFVVALQPAWWLVRGVIAAAAAVGIAGSYNLGPTLLLSLVTVPASVWVGQLSRRDRRWLWAVVPLNGLAAALLLVSASGGGSGLFGGSSSSVDHQPYYMSGLSQDGERRITDIRPVDATGRPLTGVYLFDQDGRAIDTGDTGECVVRTSPGQDARTSDPVRPYPRGTTAYDPVTGRCVPVPPAPLVAAVPSPRPTTTPTPTGTAPTTQPAPAQPAAPAAPGATPPAAPVTTPPPAPPR